MVRQKCSGIRRSYLGGQPFKKLREYRSSKRTETTSTEQSQPLKQPSEQNNKYTKPTAKSIGKSWFG